MKKAAKIASLIALWANVSFGVWMVILSAYYLIANPEAFTKFELVMSLFVSIHIAEKLIEFVFEAQEKHRKKVQDE